MERGGGSHVVGLRGEEEEGGVEVGGARAAVRDPASRHESASNARATLVRRGARFGVS